ncbi:hypothetical protein FKZ68_00830 [Bacteroides xylanisolvens]|nr:hypothetical protein FKZ68_00830 [Bacteroides xylanisolvens]
MNEKIKRKAHVKQSFSLDFLERGTFTEYPCVKQTGNLQSYLSCHRTVHPVAHLVRCISMSE